jgi:hypothetical protein
VEPYPFFDQTRPITLFDPALLEPVDYPAWTPTTESRSCRFGVTKTRPNHRR